MYFSVHYTQTGKCVIINYKCAFSFNVASELASRSEERTLSMGGKKASLMRFICGPKSYQVMEKTQNVRIYNLYLSLNGKWEMRTNFGPKTSRKENT